MIRARLPASGPRRVVQGNNQYRRVSLEAFFAAQRARVDQVLAQHVARVRERLREYENDMNDMHDYRPRQDRIDNDGRAATACEASDNRGAR